MAWQPLGRNGRSLIADRSAVTTDADGLADKPKLQKRPVIDPWSHVDDPFLRRPAATA
jgi:hypothetical protein